MLRTANVPLARAVLTRDDEEVVRAAAELAEPAGTVVLKASSEQIAHRSDHGLVSLGVRPQQAVAEARRLRDRATAAVPDAVIDGVLVCEQVSDGVEVIVGVSHKPPFGPTVMVGLGGALTELLRDVRFLVAPFTRDDAVRAVQALHGFSLLDGFRGRPPADVDALVDLIMRVQRLALAAGDRLSELDLNPVAVRPRGHGVVALDALVIAR